jgi:hypothetical protein
VHQAVIFVHVGVHFLSKLLHQTTQTRPHFPHVLLNTTLQRVPVGRVYKRFTPVLVAPHCRLPAACSLLYAAEAIQQVGRFINAAQYCCRLHIRNLSKV